MVTTPLSQCYVGAGDMPTPNGLILPFEFVDQQLKERGIVGHVDASTRLFIVRDNKPARELLTSARVRSRKHLGDKIRSTSR